MTPHERMLRLFEMRVGQPSYFGVGPTPAYVERAIEEAIADERAVKEDALAVLATARELLRVWRTTPFFERRDSWERWAIPLQPRIDDVLSSPLGREEANALRALVRCSARLLQSAAGACGSPEIEAVRLALIALVATGRWGGGA